MSKRKLKYINANKKQIVNPILLSISIMVSGREKTTEKCIASLDRLRRRVPCELILTDTGCSVELRRMLERKADKVLSFTWCNDFAAARNVGLQAARGVWFLFMDDDEWFEDTTELENFFLSGEYRRYQSASYIVRNYGDMEGSIWRDTALVRMTRKRPDTRFFYPVHESLWPLLEPVKRLADYAHHYGYASADPEVQMAKRRRNLEILMPEIEREPHCMHHYLQAVSEYLAMDDYESAIRIADEGVENCETGREENGVHIQGLYAATVRMRGRAGLYEEALRKGEEILENSELSSLARASVCGDLTIACGALGEYEACYGYLKEYREKKEYFGEHQKEWVEQETLILDSCFEQYQYRKVMGWGFAAYLSMGDAQAAEELLAAESLAWWMDVVQNWYTLASVEGRKKWEEDFQKIVDTLEPPYLMGQCPEGRDWQEGEVIFGHIRQLYGILTAPPEDAQGQEEIVENQIESSVTAEDDGRTEQDNDIAREMKELSFQLKQKVRLLIRQGQAQAALGVIQQLKMFFPQDMELAELQARCEEALK